MIAVSKYADGLPLYRQEAIYARDRVELDRSLMAQWMGRLGFELEPLADYVLLHASSRASASSPTRRRCRRWRPAPARRRKPVYGPMREMIGPLAAAVRRWSPTASRTAAPATALRGISTGYRGILQVDGYAAYHRLARPDRGERRSLLACCWAHLRRSFTSCTLRQLQPATATVERMAQLWLVEESPRDNARRQSARAAIRRPDRRRTVCALGKGAAAHLGQIQTRRSHPLRHERRAASSASLTTAGSKSTPISSSGPSARRPLRARTPSSPAATAGPDLGHHGNACDHGENERRRSLRLAQPDPRTHRERLAERDIERSCPGITPPERPRLDAYQ